MSRIGNRIANSYWEARLPPSVKINTNTDERTRTQFIRNKYENRLWYGEPSVQAGAAEEEKSVAAHPGEEGLTREQKRALRMQQRGVQPGASPSRPASEQGGGVNGYSSGGGLNSPPPPVHHHPAPSLRHAISSPQIASHAPADLFSGTTPRQALAPSPSTYTSPSPPTQAPQRSKRVTGASPWVQRPAGSEPPSH